MKYVKQIVIILVFTTLGELLSAVIPFPIPAAIYGIVLMLIALGPSVCRKARYAQGYADKIRYRLCSQYLEWPL